MQQEYTLEQLKAYGYDLIGKIQTLDRELIEVNKIIAEKSKPQEGAKKSEEVKPEIKGEVVEPKTK